LLHSQSTVNTSLFQTRGASMVTWLVAICALKLPLHAALAVTRTQDYRAKLAGKTNVMLPAVGCGKLATCSENFGCAVASLASQPRFSLGAPSGAAALSNWCERGRSSSRWPPT
jgi:hypothetical protein